MSLIRYHKKQDGILRLEPSGSARFLTPLERILFFFGIRV